MYISRDRRVLARRQTKLHFCSIRSRCLARLFSLPFDLLVVAVLRVLLSCVHSFSLQTTLISYLSTCFPFSPRFFSLPPLTGGSILDRWSSFERHWYHPFSPLAHRDFTRPVQKPRKQSKCLLRSERLPTRKTPKMCQRWARPFTPCMKGEWARGGLVLSANSIIVSVVLFLILISYVFPSGSARALSIPTIDRWN